MKTITFIVRIGKRDLLAKLNIYKHPKFAGRFLFDLDVERDGNAAKYENSGAADSVEWIIKEMKRDLNVAFEPCEILGL